jgi:hypothetical protein
MNQYFCLSLSETTWSGPTLVVVPVNQDNVPQQVADARDIRVLRLRRLLGDFF